jgi:hypothetical protein
LREGENQVAAARDACSGHAPAAATGIYVTVARLRRLRPDGGLEFRADETGERVPARSILITGRMTTVAAPARTGGFWRGARRASGNKTTVPMASPGRQRIEGTSTFQWPKRSPA